MTTENTDGCGKAASRGHSFPSPLVDPTGSIAQSGSEQLAPQNTRVVESRNEGHVSHELCRWKTKTRMVLFESSRNYIQSQAKAGETP